MSVLVDWAREFHAIVKEIRPTALVGNYQATWKDEDFWGARRSYLGLDFEALAPYVDVFSPIPCIFLPATTYTLSQINIPVSGRSFRPSTRPASRQKS